MNRKPVLLALAVGVALLLVGAFVVINPDIAMPRGTVGGPFALTDQTGRPVTDRDFRGKLALLYFGYTYCPDVCPISLARMAEAYEALRPDEQKQVVPIFISVDPDRDTVPQIAQYVAAFSPALIGLTGTPAQTAQVVKAYRVYARKNEHGSPDYTVDHSSLFYLVGRDGRLVSLFDGATTADELAAAVRKAL